MQSDLVEVPASMPSLGSLLQEFFSFLPLGLEKSFQKFFDAGLGGELFYHVEI
jgi:hypothetical protein